MGIGAQIPVSGYVYLTKGTNCNMRSKKLSQLLSSYPSDGKLLKSDLRKIYSLMKDESVHKTETGFILPASTDYKLEEIFFERMNENVSVRELLVRYTAAFEWNKGTFFEIITKSEPIEPIIIFILKDLSNTLIEAANKVLEKKCSTNLDNVKLISLIIKIHRGYQRIPQRIFKSVCDKIELLIKNEELNPPLAYKVYSIAGEYLKLEQSYRNPTNPLIPSHIVGQQRVLASLPFWTQDARSIFNFLQPYLTKELRLEEEAELKEALFYTNKGLGMIFTSEFTKEGKLQLEELMWACMSCCLDPRETFGDCLYNANTSIQRILKSITEFAIYKLGRIALATFAKEKLVIDSINRLLLMNDKDLQEVAVKVVPMLYKETMTKEDFVVEGEDSLAYRLINAAAEYMNVRGKIIEMPGSIVPLHLLHCNSLIRELKFNQMNAMDVLENMKNYNDLSSEELLMKVNEMSNPAFVKYFFNKEEDRINMKQMTLACITLCLDQGNTIKDCFWKLIETKEYTNPHHLAIEITTCAVKSVAEMTLPQLEEYPQLIAIQKKYLGMTEEELKSTAEKVMPFITLDKITKEDLKFNHGDQRLVYAILDSAVEVLGIEVMNNTI